MFSTSFSIGIVVVLAASLLTAFAGHDQAQHLMKSQPMKMAASEALWETTGDSAQWTVFAWVDPDKQENKLQVEIPYMRQGAMEESLGMEYPEEEAVNHAQL